MDTARDLGPELPNVLLNRILDDIEEGLPDGERYSGAPSAKARAAWPIVQKHAPDKTEPQCREIIRAWLKSRLLIVEEYEFAKGAQAVRGAARRWRQAAGDGCAMKRTFPLRASLRKSGAQS